MDSSWPKIDKSTQDNYKWFQSQITNVLTKQESHKQKNNLAPGKVIMKPIVHESRTMLHSSGLQILLCFENPSYPSGTTYRSIVWIHQTFLGTSSFCAETSDRRYNCKTIHQSRYECNDSPNSVHYLHATMHLYPCRWHLVILRLPSAFLDWIIVLKVIFLLTVFPGLLIEPIATLITKDVPQWIVFLLLRCNWANICTNARVAIYWGPWSTSFHVGRGRNEGNILGLHDNHIIENKHISLCECVYSGNICGTGKPKWCSKGVVRPKLRSLPSIV